MLVLAISLQRAKERNNHIKTHLQKIQLPHLILEAVDGLKLTEEDLHTLTDIEKVKRLRWWLTNGAIACALSHLRAYEYFLSTNHKTCLVVEDDAILPNDIQSLLTQIEEEISEDEVVLLYYSSHGPVKLSSQNEIKTKFGGIYYPVSESFSLMSTAGYVIGRKAAEKILRINMPVTSTPDGWNFFLKKGGFEKIRVCYPQVIKIKNFKSSIDYISTTSLKGKVLDFINNYKIPVVYHGIKLLRAYRSNKMTSHFMLVDEPSELLKNKVSKTNDS